MFTQLNALSIPKIGLQLPRANARNGDASRAKVRLARENALMALDACTRQHRRRLCLITEDDTRLHPRFLSELDSTIHALPPRWGALHLCPEFTWGGITETATPFKLERRHHEHSPGDRYFTEWPAVGGQWLGGPVAFVVHRLHAHRMAQTLRRASIPWVRTTRGKDGALRFSVADVKCTRLNRWACFDTHGVLDPTTNGVPTSADGSFCCEPEAIDMAFALQNHEDQYVARDPPLCSEEAQGGTSFEASRFEHP